MRSSSIGKPTVCEHYVPAARGQFPAESERPHDVTEADFGGRIGPSTQQPGCARPHLPHQPTKLVDYIVLGRPRSAKGRSADD